MSSPHDEFERILKRVLYENKTFRDELDDSKIAAAVAFGVERGWARAIHNGLGALFILTPAGHDYFANQEQAA